jgi:hypothetical protein
MSVGTLLLGLDLEIEPWMAAIDGLAYLLIAWGGKRLVPFSLRFRRTAIIGLLAAIYWLFETGLYIVNAPSGAHQLMFQFAGIVDLILVWSMLGGFAAMTKRQGLGNWANRAIAFREILLGLGVAKYIAIVVTGDFPPHPLVATIETMQILFFIATAVLIWCGRFIPWSPSNEKAEMHATDGRGWRFSVRELLLATFAIAATLTLVQRTQSFRQSGFISSLSKAAIQEEILKTIPSFVLNGSGSSNSSGPEEAAQDYHFYVRQPPFSESQRVLGIIRGYVEGQLDVHGCQQLGSSYSTNEFSCQYRQGPARGFCLVYIYPERQARWNVRLLVVEQ